MWEHQPFLVGQHFEFGLSLCGQAFGCFLEVIFPELVILLLFGQDLVDHIGMRRYMGLERGQKCRHLILEMENEDVGYFLYGKLQMQYMYI